MEDKPAGEQKEQPSTPDTSKSIPPPLPHEKEAGKADADETQGGDAPSAQTPPKSVGQRLKAWAWPMDFSDAVMILLTVMIAFGTIASAVAIGFQWYEMHSGGKDTTRMADAAGDQADAAQQFADSAEDINANMNDAVGKLDAQAKAIETSRKTSEANAQKALDAAIRQSRLDERAWVGVGSPTFVINQTDPIHAETNVIVLGKSPAVDIITRMGIAPYPKDKVLSVSDLKFDSPRIRNGTGFPGSTFPIKEDGEDPVSAQEKLVAASIQERRNILYFFGEVTYWDIFNAHHWTHFCYAITNSDVKKTSPCAIYNDSDADGNAKPQHPK